MTGALAAWAYAALCLATVGFHLAVAAGAPWGQLTLGGRWPGRLPGAARALPLLSSAVLAGMALAVLDRAGAVAAPLPAGAWPLACALTLHAVLANAATPSPPERRLWLPVTLGLTLALALVAWA